MYSGCSFLTKQTFSSKAGQGLERVLKVRPGERHDRCQPDGPCGARAGPCRWAGAHLALESEWSHIQRALLPKAGQNPTDVCVAVLGSGSHVLLSSCSLCFRRKQMAGRVSHKIQPKVEARQTQAPPGSAKPITGTFTMATGTWRAGAGLEAPGHAHTCDILSRAGAAPFQVSASGPHDELTCGGLPGLWGPLRCSSVMPCHWPFHVSLFSTGHSEYNGIHWIQFPAHGRHFGQGSFSCQKNDKSGAPGWLSRLSI